MKVLSPVIEDYNQLVAALRTRRHDLGLSHFELEAISGMQPGYMPKLENWRDLKYGRVAGATVLPLWLGGLGVGLQLVELPPDHPFHRKAA